MASRCCSGTALPAVSDERPNRSSAALATELARARKDSERLDWLERNVSQVVCHGVVGVAFLHDQDGNPPLRAAIDGAAQPPTGTGE